MPVWGMHGMPDYLNGPKIQRCPAALRASSVNAPRDQFSQTEMQQHQQAAVMVVAY